MEVLCDHEALCDQTGKVNSQTSQFLFLKTVFGGKTCVGDRSRSGPIQVSWETSV